jgi:DmsE family decaheme c-type cytochrome
MKDRARPLPGAAAPTAVFCATAALLLMAAAAYGPAQDQGGEPASRKSQAELKRFWESDHPSPDAKKVGTETCTYCHDDVVEAWRTSKHAAHLARFEDETEFACEQCHGAGSEHAGDPSGGHIVRYPTRSRVTVVRVADVCIPCHTTTLDKPHWLSNAHAQADVSCVDCHDFHGAEQGPYLLEKPTVKVTTNTGFRYDPKRPTTNQAVNGVCLNCHEKQVGELRQRSHHPVLEDRLNCADCHEIHRTTDAMLLPDTRELHDVCTECHTDKRGPFVYEHAPTREGGIGEACLTCHRPHGSPNPKLAVTFGRSVCTQCHTDILVGSDDLNMHRGRSGNCWRSGCHADIHGSNASPFYLR